MPKTNKKPTRAEVIKYIRDHPKLYPEGPSSKGRNAFVNTDPNSNDRYGVGQLSKTTQRSTLRNSTQKSAARNRRATSGQQATRNVIGRSTGLSTLSRTFAQQLRAMADSYYVFGYGT